MQTQRRAFKSASRNRDESFVLTKPIPDIRLDGARSRHRRGFLRDVKD